MNGYFPQGENINHETKFPKKIKFYDDLHSHISDLKKNEKNLIIMGDFNVSPEDIDIGIGEQNAKRWLREGKTSFQPEERRCGIALKTWVLLIHGGKFTLPSHPFILGLIIDQECLIKALKEV